MRLLLLALLATESADVARLARVDDALVLLDEPVHGLLAVDAVRDTDAAAAPLLLGHAKATAAAHDAVEVHAVNADSGVVLDTQVDVLQVET